MEEIVIPSTVSKIDGGFISGHPMISEKLQEVEVKAICVADGNPNYYSTENRTEIIETATGRLVQGTNKSQIPEEVTAIGPFAFFGCNNIASLTLSKSFKALEDWAFIGIRGLATLYCYPEEPPTITHFSFGGTANDECSCAKLVRYISPRAARMPMWMLAGQASKSMWSSTPATWVTQRASACRLKRQRAKTPSSLPTESSCSRRSAA